MASGQERLWRTPQRGQERLRTQGGQALLELAVFGSLLLLVLGVLLNYGLNLDHQQQGRMEAFRGALGLASVPRAQGGEYTLVRDRHVPSPSSPFGLGQAVPVAVGASIIRNPQMNVMPNERKNLPRIALNFEQGTCPGSELSPAGSNPPCLYLTADIRTDAGYSTDEKAYRKVVDRYQEVYGLTYVCKHEKDEQKRRPCDPGEGKVRVIDSCAGEIISFEGCKRQARLLTDSAFCEQECRRGTPPEQAKRDCAGICRTQIQKPWYTQAGALERVFRDTRAMGLQPTMERKQLGTPATAVTLAVDETKTGVTTTMSGTASEAIRRTILSHPLGTGEQRSAQTLTSQEDVPVDGSWSTSW